MRLLSTLYITDHRSRVATSKQALKVTASDGRITKVPLRALDAVVLLGNAQITSDALAACTEAHVRVTAIRRNGTIRFTVGGPVSGNVHLRVAQCRAADNPAHTSALARSFVAGKLHNSARQLRRWSWDARNDTDRRHLTELHDRIRERLRNLAATDDLDKIRGIEGDAARTYFKGLGHHLHTHNPQVTFNSRTRRPPRDPVNAVLGFVYALLLAETRGALDAIGLDPQVGFLHALRPGRPSLALDLLEELRPAVADRFAVSLLTLRRLTPDHFRFVGNGCYLTEEGRTRLLHDYEDNKARTLNHPLLDRDVTIDTLPLIQATLLARHLRGDLPAYPPFTIN